jgi:hypothetical protein
MEFLWVRWYGEVPGHRWGFKAARLFKVGFIPDTDSSAFGFLDPSLVLRGSHLIPAFNDGKTADLLKAQTTVARPPGQTEDWRTFYVMMSAFLFGSLIRFSNNYCIYSFVDRDMFMRYVRQGVGHVHTTRTDTSTSSCDDMTVDTETLDACDDEFQDDEDKVSEANPDRNEEEIDDDEDSDDDDEDSDDDDEDSEDDAEDSEDDDDNSEDDLGPADGEDGGDGDEDEDDNYDSF